MAAAIASLAANRQGKYGQFSDILYARASSLNSDVILEIAEETGLNIEKFKKDINDPELQKLIDRDIQEALDNNVRFTPSLFLNGRQISAYKRQAIQQKIDQYLHSLKTRNQTE